VGKQLGLATGQRHNWVAELSKAPEPGLEEHVTRVNLFSSAGLGESKATAYDFYPQHLTVYPSMRNADSYSRILYTREPSLSNTRLEIVEPRQHAFKQQVSSRSSNLLLQHTKQSLLYCHSLSYNDCQSLPNNLPNWKIHPRRLNLHLSHPHVLHRAGTQPSLALNSTHLLELVPPPRSQRHKRINPCRCHPRDMRRIRVYSYASRNIPRHTAAWL